MLLKIKKYVFEVIQPAATGHIASRIFDCLIMFFILASVISVYISTFKLPHEVEKWLFRFEICSIVIFSVEYLMRIWTSDLLYPEKTPFHARLKYIFSPLALIDLLSILPFYLPMILPVNLIGIRAIRLVRLLRIFKLNRYSDALISIGRVFSRKSKEIFASLFFVMILLLIVSLLIYYVEHDAQPEQFRNAFSGLWWAVATLTTVGYGDIYPVTAAGRILGAVIAILGIGMVAVPTGILSSGFVEMLDNGKLKDNEDELSEPEDGSKDHKHYCPYCGKKID